MSLKDKRRAYGEHFTSVNVFKRFILPEIERELYSYRWVDLFCGEGNLILPMLELVEEEKRVEFFQRHIFLFDIQEEFVEKSILRALNYGIPKEIAQRNIIQRDTIQNYPTFILDSELPVYHITNPPYLYLGYIAKHQETQKYLDYFQGKNVGYQDLYQLALINDLRNGIKKMAYIIPSNFLFGFSVSNKIRRDFFQYYNIKKAFIFEKRIFEFTGMNVIICFFEEKEFPKKEKIVFEGAKINKRIQKRFYILSPKNHFRAGNEFEDFVKNYQSFRPLKVFYYLTIDDVEKGKGDKEILVIDANHFHKKSYAKKVIYVSDELYKKIKTNVLFVKTIDTGSSQGRAGLYLIQEVFGVDGILVSKSRYRTHPIQIFLSPEISKDSQIFLKEYFNLVLEYFREKTDSEFMTTYKYSNSEYTRKYLGLLQVKELIKTYPVLTLRETKQKEFKSLVEKKDAEAVISFVKSLYLFQ